VVAGELAVRRGVRTERKEILVREVAHAPRV
jgi:hypothetical protein